MKFKIAFIFLILASLSACSQFVTTPRLRPAQWATPVIGSHLENFYQIDDKLYRSEQPNKEDLNALNTLGIKEVLNLRGYHSDDEATEQKFTVHNVPMAAGSVSEEQLLAALTIIKNRKAPLLIHCWHGSDRTGVTVAAYRIVFQNWSKAQALDEMTHGGYGYHADFFPNLVELIQGLDVAKMRQQLGIKP